MVVQTATPGPQQIASNEDAAAIVQEYFSSLENLPQEVNFLVDEIKLKEERLTMLVHRLNQRSATVLKNSRPTSTTAVAPPLSAKDQQALEKIDLEWAKVEALQSEKSALADRLLVIVNRARERGRDELKKIAGEDELEGVFDPNEVGLVEKLVAGQGGVQAVVASLSQQAGGLVGALQRGGLLPGTAGAVMAAVPAASVPTQVDEKMLKKRKTGQGGVFSNMPPPPSPLSTSNVANQSVYSQGGGGAGRKRRGQSGEDENAVVDDRAASVESGGEDEEGNGDETLYCVCQQKSYGEMIGCDNDNCRLEWFHLKCVKLEPPLPEEWYCEECTRLLKEQKKMKRKK